MPVAIGAAVASVAASAGASALTASVISYGVQLAVSYAVSSAISNYAEKKAKAAQGAQTAEERIVELTGGESEEKVIYGRAKVSGTRYMLQKYNNYIYHGIAICRHPCEEIEAIYFDDKLSTHPDFSDVELSEYAVNISTGESFSYETKTLSFSETVTADYSIKLIVEGLVYTYNALVGDTAQTVRDGLFALVNDTSEIEYSTSDTGSYNIIISRIAGSETNYNVVASIDDLSGLTTTLTSTSGGSVKGATTDGDAVLTIEGVSYTHSFIAGELPEDITEGLFNLLTTDTTIKYTRDSGTTILIERISGTLANWDLSVSIDTGIDTGVTSSLVKNKGHAQTDTKHRIIYELGSQTTANSALVSELDFADAPNRWTNDHKLTGITHINVRWDSEFLREKIGRLPAVTVVLKGKNNIYDPRSDSYVYTTNAALVTRDWLTQPYGFDAIDEELNTNTWIAAANVCDESVIINELNQTQERYAINTVITTASQPADVLSIFSQSMQAPIGWLGGGWHVKPAKYEMPDIEITVDDLAGNIQYTDRPSIQDRFNKMQGTFINPLQEWGSHDYPSIVAEDGMDEKVGNLNLITEIDFIRAQRLAQLSLLLNYASAATQIHIKRLNTYIGVDSMIYLTVDQLNWNKKPFYVANRSDNEDTTATLTLLPRQAEMFDWDYTQAQEVDTITSESIFDIREELIQ